MTIGMRHGCSLQLDNSDELFKNPIISVSIKDNQVLHKKEDYFMAGSTVNVNKDLQIVAELYKQGLTYTAIAEKLGIPRGTAATRIRQAREAGLITERRDAEWERTVSITEEANDTQQNEEIVTEKASMEAFDVLVEELKDKCQMLMQEYNEVDKQLEYVVQCKQVAQAIHKLLGDEGQDLIKALYSKVAVWRW